MKIKKVLALFAGALALLPLAACSGESRQADSMTYDQYAKAEVGADVSIEGYVQAKQSWWSNKATIYLQDDNGAYFVYELACTEEQYKNDLATGNKIQVKGKKAAYAGEVEINGSQSGAEATWKKLSGNKVYQATKLNKLADMKNHPNKLVSLDVVVASTPTVDPKRDNIYYDVTDGENVYTFCVETYLTAKTLPMYETVKTFKKGDKVTVEGFAYTYYEPQLHTTKATNKGTNVFTKSQGTLSYTEFLAAESGAKVTVEGFLAAKYYYFEQYGNVSLYLTDADGAYYVYRIKCTKDQAATLNIGSKVKVTGPKSVWAGETEVYAEKSDADQAFFSVDNTEKFLTKEVDLTSLFTNETELNKYNNQYVYFKGLEVVSVTQPTSDGGDIYFDVKFTPETGEAVTYTFCVESDLQNKDTQVYKDVLALKAGDKINAYGFLFWYDHPQLHTMKIEKQSA